MPAISVVVPVYKTPKLKLRNCIECILEQSFSDFELLLVDDGNSQDYVDLLKEYEKVDARVRVISQENQGVSAARNHGIAEAKGQYLCFVDSDDFVEESYLSKLKNAIQNADLAICGVCEQHFPVDEGWNDKRMFFSQPAIYNGLQYTNFSVNKLYKMSIINENGIRFDKAIKLGEDALFLSEYFEQCESVNCISDMLYHYVPDSASAVHKYQPDYWLWETKVIDKQWKMFHAYPLSVRQEQAMIAWLFEKIKGAVYYYSDHIDDHKSLRVKVKEIRSIPHFKFLEKDEFVKKNPHLNMNVRIILFLWLKLGVDGMLLAKNIKRILRKIK